MSTYSEPDQATMKSWRMGVCGAGAMGRGIAEVVAACGHRVCVFDVSPHVVQSAPDKLSSRLQDRIARGRIDTDTARAITERIMWTDRIENLSGCRMVIEAVVENRNAKETLYLALEEHLDGDALIATNTSSLLITALAARLQSPERFVGTHFFNPAPVMKLVEVVPSVLTGKDQVRTVMQLISTWGKQPVEVKDVPGFLVGRLARPFYGEAWRALEEQTATAPTIDHLFRAVGDFRMGPIELGDLVGQDEDHAVSSSIFAAYHGRTRFRPSLMQGQFVAAGRLGRKSGHLVSSREEREEVYTTGTSLSQNAHNLVAPAADGPMRTLCQRGQGSFDVLDEQDPNMVLAGDTRIIFSSGESAQQIARRIQTPVAVIDHAGSARIEKTRIMPFSASSDAAAETADWFIRNIGAFPIRIGDRPGGIILRTHVQLANAAADALVDRVAEADAIDSAMILGMNFPAGPLGWARACGVSWTIGVLVNIAAETGDHIYAPSEGLRRML